MSPASEGHGDRDDGASPTPSLSARVRLEVAILDGDFAAAAPVPAAAINERIRETVLVVAAEVDVRSYIRECLRERTDLRVVEAATVTAGVVLAVTCSPNFLLVDESQSEIVSALSTVPAVVIVDDASRGMPAPGTRIRLLARPFAADELLAEVRQLLS